MMRNSQHSKGSFELTSHRASTSFLIFPSLSHSEKKNATQCKPLNLQLILLIVETYVLVGEEHLR